MGEIQGIEQILEKLAEEVEEIRGRIQKVKEKTTVLGNFVNLAHPMQVPNSTWILDSGASRHVTGMSSEFTSYTPFQSSFKETIQTADGTLRHVRGVGTVKCTPSITLSSILYAPSFPVNLVSVSSLVDHMDCRITIDRENCLIEERRTGRKLGTGVRHNGLWYLDRRGTDKALCSALLASTSEEEAKLILKHCQLGHMSFDTMSKVFPDEMSKVDKSKLMCDACEYGKHTRTTYISRGLRSILPFVLVHSDVWTSPIASVSGAKYFITFIDCHSRMTWIYLMRHKSEVLKCFKNFYAWVRNQLNTCVKVIRSDNGGEYVNDEFRSFLSAEGIVHQTSCADTPPQNGVAERKNRHILEVTRSLMYTMNVPKFLWSEAVMTATYLINRMPSRILGMKTPYEMVFGKNEFIVPPKVFGCTCFVRDHRPSVGKLDPRAVKCIFIGYSSGQKGYKCWSPSERRTFVSMDVTFRESVPFYGERTDLSSLFVDLDNPIIDEDGQEGENGSSGTEEDTQSRSMKFVVGSIPYPVSEPIHEKNWRRPREEENLQVYTRRKTRSLEAQTMGQHESPMDGMEQQQSSIVAEVGDKPSDQCDTIQISSDTEGEEFETGGEETNLPIAIRKGVRSNAGKPPQRYGFEAQGVNDDENNIANYVSYASLSSTYKAFVTSLNSVEIPNDWREAKQDPRWHQAMLEELEALEKNKTWDLVPFPKGKKVVNCKWVYTVKQNPDGNVERYKARLVAKGYSQTYGIDYDETFAPVAKMSTVRTLISCAANFDWPLHQLDVKNAFLHGDLQKEVYMEIPPGFATSQTEGKVLRLKKSLYGLKQSPRAWFDRFRRAMCGMGYKQCNGDHTVFYRHNRGLKTILVVYVDDMIITGDDCLEISRLKQNLSKEFEVKDLGQLKYFLGIEIARSPRGIVLSQRKYVLDLLSDTGMLGCRPASTPIEQNYKLCAESGDPVNKERYQRLVGRLIYLSHKT
jgi:transposase InsO family protein